MSDALRVIPLAGLPMVAPGDDLLPMLSEAAASCAGGWQDGDLLVLAQKIVSKSEDRYVDLDDVEPSARALELAPQVDKDPRIVEVVLRESKALLRHRRGALIVEHKLGFVHAHAGVDRSNVPYANKVLLLPEDSDSSARLLRARIAAAGARVCVMIIDSAGRPFRQGITGYAIGCAGFEPVVNRIGTTDLFGRKLEITEIAVADELACAASVVMGQAAEGIPAVIIRGAALQPSETAGMRALLRPAEQDLFR